MEQLVSGYSLRQSLQKRFLVLYNKPNNGYSIFITRCINRLPAETRLYDKFVQENIAEGAELVLGGKRPEGAIFEKGNWYEPTILINVKHGQATTRDELFAPILPIMKVSGFEEALALTNSREEGLSAYLYSNDYKKHMKATNEM